jgi:hypothetical protein
MSYDTYHGDTADEAARVAYLLQLHQYARMQRVNFETSWEESAALVWPEYRNSFTFGHVKAPGIKQTQYQVDSTGTIAAWRFAAIAEYMMTPFNMMWSRVSTDNRDLLKDRNARIYFDEWTRILWTQRYKPHANFQGSQKTNWHTLGVFGNQGMLVDELDPGPGRGPKGLRYMQCAPGELYLLVNHQGKVDGYIRHFRWTARQAYQRWPEIATEKPALKAALEKSDTNTMFDFLEFVIPNTDYDPHAYFSVKGKPWSSIYVSIVGACILEEGGYVSFPLAHGRYSLAPEEWYGRGPCQQVLPELKTKNAEKEAFLKTAVEGGDPIRLLPEDGLFDFKATAGNYVYGGMSAEGVPLVKNLEPGNQQYSKDAMAESDKIINSAFFTDLFPLLFDRNNQPKSAREVIEVANQVAIFLTPLSAQFEYLGAMIEREMYVLREIGLAPEMPPSVKEAEGEFKYTYTGPLGRAVEAQGIAGYMRTRQLANEAVQAGGDPAIMDIFDDDVAFPEIAEQQFAPTRWMSSPQKLAERRKARQQAAERDAYIKSLPGLAAKEKAEAIKAKAGAGMNIGGTLSGVPEGGMPMMPGQSAPGGRQFG